ncbi:MAG: SpoIID/LytB domain-containing protein [Actinomycetota bacterium]
MRRRVSLTVAAALAAALFVPVTGPSAAAAGTFTFYGSGYGHGVGMSQWGAYGLALQGWSSKQILTHFYDGTKVAASDTLPPSIRVGLTYGRKIVHLTAKVGPVRIWAGAPLTGSLVGKIPTGDTWTIAAKTGSYSVRDQSGKLVGTRWGSPKKNLYVTYADTGSRVFIPEADAIWNQGFVYNRGSIEFNLYACTNGCVERLIARLGLEQYLYGLGEVPASWPMAAMQAQAVAARTYAVYAIRHVGIRKDCNCDLTDGSSDQTYIAFDREGGTDGARWVKAVNTTAHQVVTYKGNVIQSFYSASDGGHTQSVEDAWHGGDPAYAIPWLTGVCDPGEDTSANPYDVWTASYSAGTVTSRLSGYTGAIGTISGFGNVIRDASGRIMTAVAVGSKGKAPITGEQLQAALGLRDNRVWINADKNVTGAIRQRYDALMCKPGLPASPQRSVPGGAQQFFRSGGIYRNGGKDLTVWLQGAIDAEYRAVGAAGGKLGVPDTSVQDLSKTRALSCTSCHRVDFARGRIYWKAGIGAHALWGPVLTTYLAKDGAAGPLGFPTTRVRVAKDGSAKATFEHGSIVCKAGGSCSVTTG